MMSEAAGATARVRRIISFFVFFVVVSGILYLGECWRWRLYGEKLCYQLVVCVMHYLLIDWKLIFRDHGWKCFFPIWIFYLKKNQMFFLPGCSHWKISFVCRFVVVLSVCILSLVAYSEMISGGGAYFAIVLKISRRAVAAFFHPSEASRKASSFFSKITSSAAGNCAPKNPRTRGGDLAVFYAWIFSGCTPLAYATGFVCLCVTGNNRYKKLGV